MSSQSTELKLFKLLRENNGSVNIVLFPYLGGYANSFYEIAKKIEPFAQLWSAIPPGHGTSSLSLISDIDKLVDLYLSEIVALLDRKTIFVGYSMGGVVAYYLIQKIIEKQEKLANKIVSVLIMSSGAPLSFIENCQAQLSDKALLKHLNKYEALPNDVFENEYAASYLLPIFRADYGVLESAAAKRIKPIDVEANLIWGMKDQVVTASSVLNWKQYFKQPIKLTVLPEAKHMFIHEDVDSAVAWLNNKIVECSNA